MDIGIIKNREITTNRDGDANRVMLQVELIEDDLRTVELMSQAGEDVNPANGCRVYVIGESEAYKLGIAVSDDLEPEVDPGEKEIYSTDNPATTKKARLKLNSDGKIDINGSADNAVSWDDLNTALQQLVTDINAALATKDDAPGSAGTLSLNLNNAKVDSVRLP